MRLRPVRDQRLVVEGEEGKPGLDADVTWGSDFLWLLCLAVFSCGFGWRASVISSMYQPADFHLCSVVAGCTAVSPLFSSSPSSNSQPSSASSLLTASASSQESSRASTNLGSRSSTGSFFLRCFCFSALFLGFSRRVFFLSSLSSNDVLVSSGCSLGLSFLLRHVSFLVPLIAVSASEEEELESVSALTTTFTGLYSELVFGNISIWFK
mmetsp:Transcript_33181/g.93961  ORF Transcript_33181/g.93961 Transcript_33181/m.93961 type:complete len:210 (+) Transcript_33181:2725-3354(+)